MATDSTVEGMAGGALSTLFGNTIALPFTLYGQSQNRKYLNAAKDQLNQGYNAAQGTLQTGQQQANQFYSPFQQGAQTDYGNFQNYVNNATQPTQANQVNMDANSANPYLQRMSTYGMDQANQQLGASALAHGGIGGGLAKALSNNAMKYAGQYFNDANTMAMNANNQNFNQQNTQYMNNADWYNKQAANRLSLANLSGNMATKGMDTMRGYNTDMANSQVGRGQDVANIEAAKGGNAGSLFSTVGKGFGDAGSQMFNAAWKRGMQ